ncbi:hypothetical protein [Microbacterium sp. LWH12-1.2]|uniref:hypothetical protein n=1 Tax=Microbacterium sp. LWH12-1.2 TaxID=3135259 RepID=UPI00342CE5F9
MSTIKNIETLIADLDTARWDGSIYTYGQIQKRLREIMEADRERAKWETLHAKYQAVVAENAQLRTALDELNADVEEILSNASHNGMEAAKSHAIRSQMASIRRLRAQINPAPDAVPDVFSDTREALDDLTRSRRVG